MPVITGIIAAVVAIGGAVGLSAAASTFIFSAILSVGVSYAQKALAKTQSSGATQESSPAAINSPEARGNVKQSTPSQQIIVGEIRSGGKMFIYEVRPPHLIVGFLYSSLPISRFGTLYVGEKSLAFASLPENTICRPLAIDGQADFPNRLRVCVQHGSLSQGVNALVAENLAEFGDRFMNPGVACAVFECDYGADGDEFLELWGNVQIPNFTWVLQGTPLPDARVPRARLTFDPSDPEDLYHAVSTWPYSDNATLAQALWGMMPFGLGAGPESIEWADAVVSANFDDEAVGLGEGGNQKRHVVAGVLSLSDKPNVVMEALQTANRGFASQRSGKLALFSSQPREPVLTITDAMLIGEFRYRNLKPKKDLVNIGRAKFVAPDREYQDADVPVKRYDDLIALDGEEFEQTVRLSVTPTHQRAQRLVKGFVSEARLGKLLSCTVTMRAYGVREGDIVRRYSETGRYTHQNGLYSVEEWQLASNRSSVSLALSEYDPTIARDWNPSIDELPFPLEIAA